MSSLDPGSISISLLAEHCQRESERFFKKKDFDPLYCYQLFQRALVNRIEQAWEHIYMQYRPLVYGWIERHHAFYSSGEEVDYFANRAFEKMWSALTPDKIERFPNLRSLLRYLQMCVNSVITDHMRALRFTNPLSETMLADTDVEQDIVNRVYDQELWQTLTERLKNEKEQIVIYSSFVLDLKPRKIYEEHTDAFKNIGEIYRIKENVFDRLRRDAKLKEILLGKL